MERGGWRETKRGRRGGRRGGRKGGRYTVVLLHVRVSCPQLPRARAASQGPTRHRGAGSRFSGRLLGPAPPCLLPLLPPSPARDTADGALAGPRRKRAGLVLTKASRPSPDGSEPLSRATAVTSVRRLSPSAGRAVLRRRGSAARRALVARCRRRRTRGHARRAHEGTQANR